MLLCARAYLRALTGRTVLCVFVNWCGCGRVRSIHLCWQAHYQLLQHHEAASARATVGVSGSRGGGGGDGDDGDEEDGGEGGRKKSDNELPLLSVYLISKRWWDTWCAYTNFQIDVDVKQAGALAVDNRASPILASRYVPTFVRSFVVRVLASWSCKLGL